jgi:hypothetical protein
MYDKTQAEYARLCGKGNLNAPTKTAISATMNTLTAALASGFHEMASDVDCYFLQGGGTLSITAANAKKMWAGERISVPVESTSDSNLAWICDTGIAGTVEVVKKT